MSCYHFLTSGTVKRRIFPAVTDGPENHRPEMIFLSAIIDSRQIQFKTVHPLYLVYHIVALANLNNQ